jgi:hypothetical protein
MAYDPGLGATALFGGAFAPASQYQNDTWTWNGTNWTEISPADTLPPGRAGAGMDYDVVDKVMLLLGGNELLDRASYLLEENSAVAQDNPFCRSCEKALAGFDVPQRVVLNSPISSHSTSFPSV